MKKVETIRLKIVPELKDYAKQDFLKWQAEMQKCGITRTSEPDYYNSIVNRYLLEKRLKEINLEKESVNSNDGNSKNIL